MIAIPEASQDKLRMFVAYSRFEFALKECGFLRAGNDGIAHADWKRFAKAADLADVLKEAANDADVRAMIANPPQVQIVRGKFLAWEEKIAKPIKAVLPLLLAVKAIRDNLFHGGKHGEDPRDDALCRAALVVMSLCLDRYHEVRNVFEGKY
jgi:hypothetical protein